MKLSRNGQDCRPRLPQRTLGKMRAAFALSLLLIFGTANLPASQIEGFRAAAHENFIRFVFEFDGVSAAGQPVLDSRQVVLLPLPATDVRTELAGFWKPLGGVDSIRFYDWGTLTVARVCVSFDILDLRVMTLENPDRVVLDLFFDTSAGPARGESTRPAVPGDEIVHPRPPSPARAAGMSYPDWLQEEGSGSYQGAVLLLGSLLFVGIGAFLILSFHRGRLRSEWDRAASCGRPAEIDFDLIALDSMIKREMNRYERLSRLEQPK